MLLVYSSFCARSHAAVQYSTPLHTARGNVPLLEQRGSGVGPFGVLIMLKAKVIPKSILQSPTLHLNVH